MKFYLTPNKLDLRGRTLKDERQVNLPPSRRLNNFASEINLLAYCLMSNHFHLFIQQKTKTALPRFMQSLITKYVGYFNRKYDRHGALFQGKYRAVRVKSENQFIYLTKYIHRNPLPKKPTGSDLEGLANYKYSSYGQYIGLWKQDWVKSELVLKRYLLGKEHVSYRKFVEEVEAGDQLDNRLRLD